ncbi:LPS biosynthesis protein [Alsobacter metallidurans]|uniref:LPS biosynthesis protein n=1 Tax=Alsobacter metallidurans TaxID=340221 RepID=A0A917MIM4_9HYPH|nr:exopolysaccharide transport family protein [Alsobacter metallidurans]GGH21420.1 LPS biosynthesis protein [Alsobacter metallidurans]
MADAGPVPANGGDLDAGQLGRALRRRSPLILLATLIVFGLTAFWVNTATPRYTADARILLQPGDNYYTRPGQSAERDLQIDEREVASQVLLVTSRDLAKRAVDRLQLKGNPEFDTSASVVGVVKSGLVYLGLARASENEQLIDRFVERVTAFPVGQTRVLAIEFTSSDPVLAARGANAIADIYLELQEEAKLRVAQKASSWLNGAIEPLRQKVADAEAKVEAFRSGAGLLVATNNATLQQQQLAELNTQLNQVRGAQADSQAKAKLLREALAGGRTLDVSDVANNDLVRKLVTDRTTAKAQIALESRSLGPGHPRMKELQAQLADIDAQISAAALKAVRTLENDARVAQARVDALASALDATKQQSIAAGEKDVELRALEREARSQREQLEAMMTRYREATARDVKDASPPDARIVQRADPPVAPSFPKKGPMIIIATLATLLVMTVWVICAELLSGRAFGPVPVSYAPTFPLGAGAVPAAQPAAVAPVVAAAEPAWRPRLRPAEPGDLASAQHALAPAEHALARLAADAAQRRPAEPPREMRDGSVSLADAASAFDVAIGSGTVRRCLVTPIGGAPARDLALALGRRLASARRLALIDADTAGRETTAGFAELISGHASFIQVIHRDPASRLHLVSSGALTADAITSQAAGVELALGALSQTYDAVMVATPPAEERSILRVLAQCADMAVLAVGPNASADEVADAAASLSAWGLRVVRLSVDRAQNVEAA